MHCSAPAMAPALMAARASSHAVALARDTQHYIGCSQVLTKAAQGVAAAGMGCFACKPPSRHSHQPWVVKQDLQLSVTCSTGILCSALVQWHMLRLSTEGC